MVIADLIRHFVPCVSGGSHVRGGRPWGGQVSAQGSLTRGLARLWIEFRRVLAPDGSAVILIPDARELATAIRTGFTPTHVRQVRVSGRQSFIVRLSRV